MFTFPISLFTSQVATRYVGGTTSSTAGGASYNFTGIDIGISDSTRYVVVAIEAIMTAAGDNSIASLTIAGNSAPIIVQNHGTSGAISSVACLAGVAVASGTTATIAITARTSTSRIWVTAYALYNLSSTTPFGTGSNGGVGSNSTSTTCNVPSGGVQIGSGVVNANETLSWTGITKDSQSTLVASTASWASDQNTSSATGKTFASSGTSTTDPRAIAVATWV